MTERSDGDWVRQINQKDEGALIDLWDWLNVRANTIANRQGISVEELTPAIGKAYEQIVTRGVNQYDFRCPFLGYCLKCLVNTILKSSKKFPSKKSGVNIETVEIPTEDPESQADWALILARLQPCLDELTPMQQQVIHLQYLDEWLPQAIADQLGISRGYVNKLAFDARKKLRLCLQEHGFASADDLLSL